MELQWAQCYSSQINVLGIKKVKSIFQLLQGSLPGFHATGAVIHEDCKQLNRIVAGIFKLSVICTRVF